MAWGGEEQMVYNIALGHFVYYPQFHISFLVVIFHVAQVGLKLTSQSRIILNFWSSWLLECWNYKDISSHLIYALLVIKYRASCMQGMQSTNWAASSVQKQFRFVVVFGCWYYCSETASHVVHIGFELSIELRLALNSLYSCLHLLSVEIRGLTFPIVLFA